MSLYIYIRQDVHILSMFSSGKRPHQKIRCAKPFTRLDGAIRDLPIAMYYTYHNPEYSAILYTNIYA